MTDNTRDEPDRYDRLGPIARALVDDHDACDLAEMLVKVQDQLAALRLVSRGYCPDCGRGDAAPTVEDWEQQKQRADKAERERDGISRVHLTAMGNLGIATHRLDQIRDAARLHEQTLISARELYAVIDADSAPVPAATETTEPERCCVCGGGPIAHHNYREQPFCWACADCPCNQVPCIREGLHQSAEGKLKVAEQRARNAEARIRLAREALIHDGYFTADEIGDDIAPRLVEWLAHHRDRARKAEQERDEARQHTAAIAAQRDRLRQRMNHLADRWEYALAVDKPYGRTLRSEISVAPFCGTSTAVRPYRADDGSQKWATRCWGTEACDGWLSLDHSSQQSAERARDRHVAEEHGTLKNGEEETSA